ncbi:hypothetical protein BU14_0266s0013 [Porphyra umbilicalis]|uniref:Uncharacterized protein n=1 Tax=Porphyra umbilicalis TaxID=2786 RepID=A0A1X6P1S1_PORUM|nr:hypothetical protein BU14_0266s0013 [Porphyra umbilicalis]|eukprot:OSX74824.1 hypothetical protein BU14_0266s0013 [Porphyra umbilicalis]
MPTPEEKKPRRMPLRRAARAPRLSRWRWSKRTSMHRRERAPTRGRAQESTRTDCRPPPTRTDTRRRPPGSTRGSAARKPRLAPTPPCRPRRPRRKNTATTAAASRSASAATVTLALVDSRKHAPPNARTDARSSTGKHAHRPSPATDTNGHAAQATRVDKWQRRTEAAPCSRIAAPTAPTMEEKSRGDRRGAEQHERHGRHVGDGQRARGATAEHKRRRAGEHIQVRVKVGPSQRGKA